MKTKTFFHDQETFQVITHFGNSDVPEDGLYDDCPICQKLRRELEAGRAETVEVEEGEEDE